VLGRPSTKPVSHNNFPLISATSLAIWQASLHNGCEPLPLEMNLALWGPGMGSSEVNELPTRRSLSVQKEGGIVLLGFRGFLGIPNLFAGLVSHYGYQGSEDNDY
jgi:hypothetical protein